jgi:hypothetical protein
MTSPAIAEELEHKIQPAKWAISLMKLLSSDVMSTAVSPNELDLPGKWAPPEVDTVT